MEDLINALKILLKYGNPQYPTHCIHDCLVVCGIDPSDVSSQDKEQFEELGFYVSSELGEDHFASYRFGSA